MGGRRPVTGELRPGTAGRGEQERGYRHIPAVRDGESGRRGWLIQLPAAAALAAGMAGAGLTAAGVHSAVRTVLVLLFLAAGPTAAVAGLLRGFDPLARLAIAFAADIALLTLTAIVMLAAGLWSPTGGLLAATVITTACLAPQLPWPRKAAGVARPPVPGVPGLISVVICAHTRRRWDQTRAAVESVRAQSFQNREIIVVVDHNPALHAALEAALPGVTVAQNRQHRGLSGARNTGVAIARGDVVAFLDDDAVADPDWLKFLADAYANPAVAGVGGLILPSWQAARPRWFPDEFGWVVGCTYRGMPRGPVRNLLGASASFRRDAFELAGGFRDGIGRSASKRPLGCEETEFCIRLSQRAPESVFLFDDRAVVWHQVPPRRGRFSYFCSRCYAEGLSKAQVTASVGAGAGLAVERRYASRTLPAGVARAAADALRGDPSGLGRAGAIVAGLAATAAGYGAGSARRRLPTRRRAVLTRGGRGPSCA